MINRVDCVYNVVLNVLSICIEFPCVLIQLGLGGVCLFVLVRQVKNTEKLGNSYFYYKNVL